MKKYYILLFLIFSTSITFAIPLSGYWGIPWNSTIQEADSIMKSKGFISSYKSNGLLYNNIEFANREGTLALAFYEDKFYLSAFMIKPEINKSFSSYKELVDDITAKYGSPTISKEEYRSPYRQNDGFTENAILMNYATIFSIWVFDDGDFIMLSVNKDHYKMEIDIMILYVNYLIKTLADNNLKDSILGDL